MKLQPGAPLQCQSKEGRWTMAHIVDCQPMDSGQQGWKLGAMLDEPDNFWGLESCPEDWARLPEVSSSTAQKRVRNAPPGNGELKAIVGELVAPLNAEVVKLRQKLGQAQPKRSRLDISLIRILPEGE